MIQYKRPQYCEMLASGIRSCSFTPSKIYVDRQTYARLSLEFDAMLVQKVRNGDNKMRFMDIPVYQVLDDEPHMEFV